MRAELVRLRAAVRGWAGVASARAARRAFAAICAAQLHFSRLWRTLAAWSDAAAEAAEERRASALADALCGRRALVRTAPPWLARLGNILTRHAADWVWTYSIISVFVRFHVFISVFLVFWTTVYRSSADM